MQNSKFRTYQQVIGRLNYIAFIAFVISLPYPMHFVKLLAFIWFGLWILEMRWLQRVDWNSFRADRSRFVPTMIVATFFIWNLLSVAWAGNKHEAWHSINRLLNIVAIIPFAIWGFNEHYNWKQLLKIFIITCCASILVYLFNYYWMHNPISAYDRNVPIGFHIDFLKLNEMTIIIKHRLQYSTLLCLCMPCLALLYPDMAQKNGKVEATISVIVIALWLCCGIYWSGSRAGILNLCIIATAAIILHFNGHKRIWATIVAVALFCIAITTVNYLHPRMQSKGQESMFYYNPNSSYPANEPRIAIWHAAVEKPSEYLLYGKGTGQAEIYMTEKYTANGWNEYANHHYSPHNCYLNIAIELGIFALFAFIAALLYLPQCYQNKKTKQFVGYATLIIASSMLTDVFIGGIEGLLLVTTIYIFSILINKNQELK